MPDSTDPDAPLLRLSGVSKRFGAVQALSSIDLDIPAGQVTALAGATLALSSAASYAQEVVLKAVSGFPEGTLLSTKYEGYIKEVNAKGPAVKLRIQYLGGVPKVMPTFDVGKNLKDGIIDLLSTPGAYYTNVLPEADAFKLTELSIHELRKNGAAGTPEEVVETLQKWQAAGAERMYLQVLDISDLDHLSLIAAEVAPHVS